MDFNFNQYRKINYQKLIMMGSLILGGILIFISIFIPYPVFIYTASIGALLVVIHLILKWYEKYKNRVPKTKVSKSGVQKTTFVKGEQDKVIAICPSCNQKLRLPYNKGIHNVTCPKCKCEFKVKNR